MNKKAAIILLIGSMLLTSCSTKQVSSEKYISITDDVGTKIELKNPAKKIISLYSAHTENLFSLGLNEEIVGVGKSESYPKEALKKKSFDYKGDPEEIIKEKPDVVLMRTTITKTNPDFVKKLQDAGIQVVTLYPENFNDFDKYITNLGVITGKEKEAKAKLEEFHKNLDEIKAEGEKISNKKNIFLETMSKGIKTATKDSFAYKSIEFAGGVNVAKDIKDENASSTILAFGEEKLLSMAKEIDVYVAQKGAMNSDVSENVIKSRPGFDKIKAIKDNKIVIVDEKLVSSPTFRYVEGVKQLQKSIYPELSK